MSKKEGLVLGAGPRARAAELRGMGRRATNLGTLGPTRAGTIVREALGELTMGYAETSLARR
jgi:hypothetical protein